jgi:hypothetical protein
LEHNCISHPELFVSAGLRRAAVASAPCNEFSVPTMCGGANVPKAHLPKAAAPVKGHHEANGFGFISEMRRK